MEHPLADKSRCFEVSPPPRGVPPFGTPASVCLAGPPLATCATCGPGSGPHPDSVRPLAGKPRPHRLELFAHPSSPAGWPAPNRRWRRVPGRSQTPLAVLLLARNTPSHMLVLQCLTRPPFLLRTPAAILKQILTFSPLSLKASDESLLFNRRKSWRGRWVRSETARLAGRREQHSSQQRRPALALLIDCVPHDRPISRRVALRSRPSRDSAGLLYRPASCYILTAETISLAAVTRAHGHHSASGVQLCPATSLVHLPPSLLRSRRLLAVPAPLPAILLSSSALIHHPPTVATGRACAHPSHPLFETLGPSSPISPAGCHPEHSCWLPF